MNKVYFHLSMGDNDYSDILESAAKDLLKKGLLTKAVDCKELKSEIIKFVIDKKIRYNKEMADLLNTTVNSYDEERISSYVNNNLKMLFQNEIPKSIIVNGNGENVYIMIKTLPHNFIECVGPLTY